MIHHFDIIVIGAGPAGGKCASELARRGINVLLVERYKSFAENDFSSAGMLTETITDFSLPEEVIASYWSNFVVQTTSSKFDWKSEQQHGVVLNFAKLKGWYADECRKYGGTVWMGHRYESKELIGNKLKVILTDVETNTKICCQAKLIIDATGPARRVIYDKNEPQPEMLVASGIEYLVQVSDEVYDRFKNDLIFFLGDKWTDNGYSWIFPMDNNTLKVGSGRGVGKGKQERKELKQVIDEILKDYMNAADYAVLDVHGGSLRFAKGQKDLFYRNGVLGIGDATSTVNPLGGEGIRYAIESAEMAVPYIERFLRTNRPRFRAYRRKWRRKYYRKWQICELMSVRVYLTYNDEKIENRIAYLHRTMSIEDIKDLLFRFNFARMRKKIGTLLFSFSRSTDKKTT